MKTVTIFVMLLITVFTTSCAAVVAPAAPAIPVIAVSPIVLPATSLAVVVGALNVSSAPPPNPCDLAAIAWQLLNAAKGIVHHPYGTTNYIEIQKDVYDAGYALDVGPDSMGQNHSITLQKLVEWLKLCPANFKVENTFDGWPTVYNKILTNKIWK